MTQAFIRDISAELGIPVPQVVHRDRLLTETMMAMISSDGTELVLRRNAPKGPDLFFSIAHELRHGWQIAHPELGLMVGYRDRTECRSVEEYNLQPAELDANAFAAIVMERDFGLKALFQGLPETVRKAIRRRASEIKAASGC